ncbi:sigma-70 family RNA polymerase sigma factor [Flagellimonas lutimaris]|uniref:sigma-70 family RNA polymerase sigma factor n=1 Tax=Flagellimonas lutimaris TaxID=475082 RepID=UPI003F5CCBF9
MPTVFKITENYNQLLFPYAYNVLGSIEDSQDVIHDVVSKFLGKGIDGEVDNIKGYLIKSVINRAINVKNRQKKIVLDRGELPDPIATDRADTSSYLNDIVSYSLLILLEKLNVKERAVFILKEAFDYSHAEIAEVLSTSTENSRKLLSRAKLKIKKDEHSQRVSPKKTHEYLNRYVQAIRNKDIDFLETLLTDDISVVADGGDSVKVVRRVTTGKKLSMDLLIRVDELFLRNQEIKIRHVNHQPAILYYENNILTSCQIFSVNKDQQIHRVSSVVDPRKLQQVNLMC